VKQVSAAIRSLDSEQVVYGAVTMEQLISDAVTAPRFLAFLIGAFALLAVVMASVGMYSVISCLVAQRTTEIAVRIALGAGRRSIAQTVLGTTMSWIAIGLSVGLALGLIVRNTIQTLSGAAVEGSPWMYISVVVFFVVVTLLAALIPIQRAIRLDPSTALRCD